MLWYFAGRLTWPRWALNLLGPHQAHVVSITLEEARMLFPGKGWRGFTWPSGRGRGREPRDRLERGEPRGFMDEDLPSWGTTRPEPTAETHTARAEQLDRCVYCGVPVTSFRCKCGYWCSECRDCSAKNTEWTRRHIIQKHAQSIADRIDADTLARFSAVERDPNG